MKEKRFLTVEEMAEYLTISRPSAYKLTKISGFPKIILGERIIRIPIEALDSWIVNNME